MHATVLMVHKVSQAREGRAARAAACCKASKEAAARMHCMLLHKRRLDVALHTHARTSLLGAGMPRCPLLIT